jgi:hypothetical protein
LCWSGDDHLRPLIERTTSWLVVNKVLLPDVSVLERFVGRIRDWAQKRLWKRLVAALDEKQRERIAKLFDKTSETSFAALDALRTVPTQRSSSEFLHHLDRLDAIRAFDLRPSSQRRVADGAHRSPRAETMPRRGLGMASRASSAQSFAKSPQLRSIAAGVTRRSIHCERKRRRSAG